MSSEINYLWSWSIFYTLLICLLQNLAAEKTYNNLDITIAQALQHRQETEVSRNLIFKLTFEDTVQLDNDHHFCIVKGRILNLVLVGIEITLNYYKGAFSCCHP